jgi:putative acetyltransferase
MTHIRVATSLDRDGIREVHLSAFPDSEKQMVSTLAVNLRDEQTIPQTISLVAEAEGSVVGHIAFSPVTIDYNEAWRGYILAPLGVRPEYQKHQIGSKLILSGIERLSKMGVNVLFVYGDPDYYGRFGFNADTASGYLPPYTLQYTFGWQAMILNAGNATESVSTNSAVKVACVDALNDPALW